MAELHIYRGLPGSGKSTLAENRSIRDNGRRVGRDRIRKLIGAPSVGTNKQETEVTEIQGRLITEGLKSGQNVHVDDLNLKVAYVKRLMALGDQLEAKSVVHDLCSVPVETCILRDAARTGSDRVGAEFIRKTYERFIKGKLVDGKLPVPVGGESDPRLSPPELYIPNSRLPEAMLVDLDGTVALKWKGRGFHDYDQRVFHDTPNAPVIQAVRALIRDGVTPVFVSGRKGNEECRRATYAWIGRHITPGPLWLYMRRPEDNRPDWMVKREIFDLHIRHHWNVLLAFDDRNQVVDEYRRMGLPVFQVAPGNF